MRKLTLADILFGIGFVLLAQGVLTWFFGIMTDISIVRENVSDVIMREAGVVLPLIYGVGVGGTIGGAVLLAVGFFMMRGAAPAAAR